MKKIDYFDVMLRDAYNYYDEINSVKKGDEADLQIVLKPNGYLDIFAFVDGLEIGELPPYETENLMLYLQNREMFQINSVIKKKVRNREDDTAVVLDITVFADDNFDGIEFFSKHPFDKSKFDIDRSPTPKPVFVEQQPTTQPKKKERGCFFWVMVLMGILFLLIILFSSN